MKTLLLAALFSLSTGAFASHAKINCGPIGYWSGVKKPVGYVIYINNDDSAKVMGLYNGFTGADVSGVLTSRAVSVNAISLSEYMPGLKFVGQGNFSLKFGSEFFRPQQKKDRRYFNAKFSTLLSVGKISGDLECVVGLK